MTKHQVADLHGRVTRFLKRHGMKPTKFGRLAMNDPGFVKGLLKEGRSPTMRTAERIETFMKEYVK